MPGPLSHPDARPARLARLARRHPLLAGALAWLRRRLADEQGVVTVEFVIVVPMLFWAYLMTYVFSDAYRDRSLDVKASYTIADAVSREQAVITPGYIDTLYRLQAVMTGRPPEDLKLRVSAIKMVGTNPAPQLGWSQGRGGAAPLTQAGLDALSSRIPTFQTGETMVLVETWQDYVPGFDTLLSPVEFASFVPTKIRFAPQLCYSAVTPPTSASTVC